MRGRTAIVLLVSASLLTVSCTGRSKAPTRSPPARELAPVEVRRYEGRNLSSANDFRENSIKGPQRIDKAAYRLEIGGSVSRPQSLSYEQVLNHQKYSKVVTLHCVEGWDAAIHWEGVKVKDLLADAGFDTAASVVIFTSFDGYTTSLPLSYILARDILLAFRMNDVPLPPERGFPFVLVAEDRWGYKWAKWVTRIEVSSDASFRGYWEQRGYSQGGELEKPFSE